MFEPINELINPPASEPSAPAGQARPGTTKTRTPMSAEDLALAKRQQERLCDYHRQALEDPDHELALLGSITARCAKWTLRLDEAISQLASECQDAQEYLERIPPELEVMLKLGRQCERNLRLAQDLKRGPKGETSKGSPQTKEDAGNGEEIEV